MQAAIISKLRAWVCRMGKMLKRLIEPTKTVGATATGVAFDLGKTNSELLTENALLRQQVIVLRRGVKRPAIGNMDRVLMILFAKFSGTGWKDSVHVVKPATLLRWHRDLFKLIWKRKSRPMAPARRISTDVIELIQHMAISNVTWGAERIRGELLKLGIRVSKRTIQKYIKQARPPGERDQTWPTFVKNHMDETWACDFLQLYDACFRPIFAFFVVQHETREVVHFNVTRSPSAGWATQQLREATEWGEGPRFLIRDNDGKYGAEFDAVAEGAGIDVVKIPPRSPNLNPICERFLGSVRRECLDHLLILGEDHLRRVLGEYVRDYFNTARPHQGIEQRIPCRQATPPMPIHPITVAAKPILGGLHHDYRLAA